MNKILALMLLFPATIALAGQPKITETNDKIIVEYTGTPAEKSSENVSPVTQTSKTPITRMEYLTAQIEKLSKEVDELSILTGKETDEELQRKAELTKDKNRLIEEYRAEILRINENSQKSSADKAKPGSTDPDQAKKSTDMPATADQTINQQMKRQQMKQEIKGLQQQRRTLIYPPNQ